MLSSHILDRSVISVRQEHIKTLQKSSDASLKMSVAGGAGVVRDSERPNRAVPVELQTQLRNKLSWAASLNLYATADLKLLRRAVSAHSKPSASRRDYCSSTREIALHEELQ